MQGLADGYFVIPYTLANYFASTKLEKVSVDDDAFKSSVNEAKSLTQKLMSSKGSKTVDEIHRQLGHVIWDYCGMSRSREGLQKALSMIANIKEEFWNNVRVLGDSNEVNQELEKAGRVADFIELGDLMCRDALTREESCGGHFREEYQTPDNEALRNDEKFCHVAAWEFKGETQAPARHQEELKFENVKLAVRSYK
jgi:succinate dehydrogenase / fumarate reductase flavoprotein subunit